MKPQISVILCVNTEMTRLPKLWKILEEQSKKVNFELLVSDSGSKDDSVRFLKQKERTEKHFRVKLFQIKPQNFGHGKARNFLAKFAQGEFLIFFSADVFPVTKNWFLNLIKPFADQKVQAVFGRQVPYKNASVFDQYFYSLAYPRKDKIITLNKEEGFSVDTVYFSMVNAAMRKSALQKNQFVENKDASVDQWWAKKILENGGEIFYTAKAAVFHSHNYSYSALFKRQFSSGHSLIGFPKASFLKSVFDVLRYLRGEFLFILRKGSVKELLQMPLYEAVRFSGFFLGSQANNLPKFFVNKFYILKSPRFEKK
mgnify:CR=1 FL=1